MDSFTSGVNRSEFDGRDYIFQPAARGLEADPAREEMTIALPWTPWNQGRNGDVPCCVSVAVVTAMEVLDAQNGDPERLSMLFHYYATRFPKNETRPLTIRAGLHEAATTGVCSLANHQPQFPEEIINHEAAMAPPSPEAEEDAERRCLVNYDPRRRRRRYWHFPDPRRIEDWRAALYAGMPVIFMFRITRGYMDLENTDAVHGSIIGRPVQGGYHAVVALGYDDHYGMIRVRDSLGPDFCENGWWYMPYSVIQSPWIIEEAWTAEAITY